MSQCFFNSLMITSKFLSKFILQRLFNNFSPFRTISCFDLQELLEACLPNDYIRSCANLDVCRQIVCLMDKQNRSRITFNDFKLFMINLKTWQGVFKMHTKEKTGILRAERFRDALCDVGFQLSTDILSILILK